MHYLPVYTIQLVRESSHRTENSREITRPAEAAEIIRELCGNSDREEAVILLLNTRHSVSGVHRVSMGSLNASIIHPRECFKAAILANAASIILGHNHPSGETNPSKEDQAITARLVQAGELLGIPLLDSLIVGPDWNHFSFKDKGLM